MKATDIVSLKGKLTISLNDKVVRVVDNLVVTAGKNWIASRMQGVVDAAMSHMAIGTGTTAAVIGDTTLETEVARTALTTPGGSVAGNVITFLVTVPADVPDITDPATTPVTEAGIFNHATTGSMAARTVFPVINKGEADSMTISWDITIS